MADSQDINIEYVDDEEEKREHDPRADDKKDPSEGDVEYDEDAANLVDDFLLTKKGKAALREIAETVCDNTDEMREATEEYRARMEANWSIFTGNLVEKSFPWTDCANVHVPIMLTNTTRIVFRAFGELFADWDNVCGVAPLGPNDEETAQLVTLHSNWQIRQQIPDFKRQMFRGMLMFFVNGDCTCQSWYDPTRRMNRHEFLSADEFMVPFAYTSTMPDYSDVPYRCKIIHRQKHELEAMRGTWSDVDAVIDERKPSWSDDPEQALTETVSEIQGAETTEASSPYKLYWYEGWFDLPNQDKQRFCKVIVDAVSKAVLELTILEYPNWQDVQRFESQAAELSDYRAQSSMFDQQTADQTKAIGQLSMQATGAANDMGPEQSAQVGSALQGAQEMQATLQPPIPPTWMKDPEDPAEMPAEPRKDPIHLFTHFVLIEPLVGNLGIGYGQMEADFNRAANTAMNQAVDAATIGNVGVLLKSSLIKFKEKTEIRPGAIIDIEGVTGEELKSAIMPLKFDGANPQMFEIVDKMYQYGSDAMQAPSVLSGDPGKSGETFRGISARIEQATKQTSVGTRRFGDGVEWVLKANAFLNSIHLDDEELFHVAVSGGQQAMLKEMKIGRRLYERNYKFEIRADLRFVTQSQKIQEADELLNIIKAVPQLAQDQCLLWQVMAGVFRARGREDLVTCLGPTPPSPETVFGMPPPAPPPPPGMPQAPPGAQGPPAQGPHLVPQPGVARAG